MKILYAATNNANSKIQLARFLDAMHGSAHQIKVAAYKESSPKNTNIDWILDCLFNIYKPELISLYNDNLSIYYEQVKSYGPDLIISDLEYFTSYIANDLGIALWQCSSSLINYALTKEEKYDLSLFKYYAYSLNRDPSHTQRTVNIIDNSNYNLVYSHYGDLNSPPQLQNGFNWVRPYHQMGQENIACQHYVVAGLSRNNKHIIDILEKYPDSIVFTEFCGEQYQNVQLKDIEIVDEYFCNIKNSSIFICQGQTSFLADAFYNGKYSLIYPDFKDTESIINSQLSDNLNLGHIVYLEDKIFDYSDFGVNFEINEKIRYLHELIEEI